MDKLHIVKIGGGLLSDEKLMASALSSFHALVGHKILIHGGGKQANELCEKLGIQPNMHNGRRITDDATLDVVIPFGYGNISLAADADDARRLLLMKLKIMTVMMLVVLLMLTLVMRDDR